MREKNARSCARSPKPCVLGVDPGIASMGISVIRVLAEREEVILLDVARTQRARKKLRRLESGDLARRATELWRALQEIGTHHEIVAVAVESMSWPRNASSAAKLSAGWAMVVAIAEAWGVPLLEVAPQEVKLAMHGSRSASKDKIKMALLARYPDLELAWRPGVAGSQRVHGYDALAVGVVALENPAVIMLRRALC